MASALASWADGRLGDHFVDLDDLLQDMPVYATPHGMTAFVPLSLPAGQARHCQPLRSPPLRGQYYDQVQLWQPFTLRIDHSPRLPFTPVVVTPLGEKLIYAMHFFSGRRRVGDCHTFFQQEALPPGYGFVLLSLDTMAIWMAPTGLCWWSSWGLALVHLASLAHHVKLSLQHGTCRLQMACAVLHDHFGQRKRFGVSLIAVRASFGKWPWGPDCSCTRPRRRP